MRLLLAEDDMVLGDGLTRSLQQLGYAVDGVKNGADADHALAFQNYDLLILDLGLPKMDGLEVLKRLRFRDKSIPVLILTARDAIGDRVTGLDLGADDYLTKPFDLAELEARVRALVRRGQGAHSNILKNGPLMLNVSGRRAYIDENPLELSARELGVLEILMLKAGQVVGKEQLAEKLCNWDEEIGPNAIEVYIHRLRKKLECADIQIRTIRGLGYLLEKMQ
ncbi:MAG: response regulator [Burkholderiales bacterium]|nr:response regulator [Burkholderiales bacterium]